MANHPPSLRFDHREIAVIFSLFIFVSLLMFTVGIVVGKGLAQARYESLLLTGRTPASRGPQEARLASGGVTSLSLPARKESPKGPPPETKKTAAATQPAPQTEPAAPSGPLKLIPKTTHLGPGREPSPDREAERLANDPRIKPLLEGTPTAGRKTASVAPAAANTLPQSFGAGPYTVQVGSYPTKTDAEDRITQLKKLGFPHAYLSIKKFGDGKEIWYRVWLGYYPDTDTAKKSGEFLQQRGEVNNYLIRKSDNPG